MSINISVPPTHELKPRITVIGVGGAGCNAVNNMISSHLEGVEFIVSNTDAQSLANSLTEIRVQLGANVTQGLGAGARPEVGRAAADESIEQIMEYIEGTHMLFVTAGMGGGTGTGAAPVIAKYARERGILTVGVVTKPFHFEGSHRMKIAEAGIEELEGSVDTLIVIPNQNLFKIANAQTTFPDAFKMADKVLYSGVRGVTDLMFMPGLINLDFADVRSVMMEMGKAMMGTGDAEGDNRALDSASAAIANPLLDDVSLTGARGVLVNITGGPDLTLFEVDEIVDHIRQQSDDEVNLIFGATTDEEMTNNIRVSVVATGIGNIVKKDPIDKIVETNLTKEETVEQKDEKTADISENVEQKVPFSPLAQSFMSEKEETPVIEENEIDVLEKNTPQETKISDDDISSSFIPPEPEKAENDLKSEVSEELKDIDPFAEAEVLNATSVKYATDRDNNLEDKAEFKEKEDVVKENEKKEQKLGLIKRITSAAVFGGQAKTSTTVEKKSLRSDTKPYFTGVKTAKEANNVVESTNLSENKIEKQEIAENLSEEDNNLTDIPAFLRRQND